MTNFFTMNNKFFAAVALLLGTSFASFAGDNNKDGKATNESSVAASVSAPQTFYVTARSATTYTLSTSPSGACDDTKTDPCQITVDDPENDVIGNQIDRVKVDTEDGVSIDSHRQL